jgi:hypothetical protein
MRGVTPDFIFLLIALVAVTALAIGVLAYICAKKKAIGVFFLCVTAAWLAAGWVLGHPPDFAPHQTANWRLIADALLTFAPLAFVPALFTAASVTGKVPTRRIPVLSIAGSLLALPCMFALGWASSCFIVFTCR